MERNNEKDYLSLRASSRDIFGLAVATLRRHVVGERYGE